MTNKDARTPASTQNPTEASVSGESTTPIGWHKAYVEGTRPDLRVPVRQVHLTNGESVTLYDTSGPYTDPHVDTDVRRGLTPLRENWIVARRGEITPEVECVAIRENVSPEVVREEIAAGRAVLPANVNHPETEPMIIGKRFLVKVNANIGNSAVTSSIEEEVEKMTWATR